MIMVKLKHRCGCSSEKALEWRNETDKKRVMDFLESKDCPECYGHEKSRKKKNYLRDMSRREARFN